MKYLKIFVQVVLGLFMTYAGVSHLTFARQEFVAQVPTWPHSITPTTALPSWNGCSSSRVSRNNLSTSR